MRENCCMAFTELLETQTAAAQQLTVVPDASVYRGLSEADLLGLAEANATVQRLAAVHGARIAGEVARRSAPELGGAGLSQKRGFRTPENLVKAITGSTRGEAATAVRIGRMADDVAETTDAATGECTAPSQPWLAAVAAGMAAGAVSVVQADAIRNGIGVPTDEVTSAMLAEQVEVLVGHAATQDADWLFKEARHLRDLIDARGVAEREEARYLRRSWKLVARADGTGYSLIEHDAISFAIFKDVYDRATSPRRGGPRFVDPEKQSQAQAIIDDKRTTEQLAHDVIVSLIEAGGSVDDTKMLNKGGPQIRVLMTLDGIANANQNGTPTDATAGQGQIEGQPDPVSKETVEREICDGVVIPVIFDQTGQAIDVGKAQRLFSIQQRIILAVMFGGCMFPGCDRPPSWCEAHHILHVQRDGGDSTVDNGILLCRHHHHLLHNNGWEIRRTGKRGQHYWLIPPPDVDPEQTPIRMPKKSRAYTERYPNAA